MNTDNLRSGYIKTYRSIWNQPKSKDPCYIAVWFYLLHHVVHKPTPWDWFGKTIILKPGQIITGRKILSAETGVSESKVRRLLERMKTDQQIDQQATNQSSLITIRNWWPYQCGDQQIDQRPTSDRPATDQRPTTKQECKKDKECKKEKRDLPLRETPEKSSDKESITLFDSKNRTPSQSPEFKENNYSPAFIEFWKAYPRRTDKGGAWRKWKQLRCDAIIDRILRAIEKQKTTVQWSRDHIYAHPTTWLNGRRWEDEPDTVQAQPPAMYSPEWRKREEARRVKETKDYMAAQAARNAELKKEWAEQKKREQENKLP